MSSLSFQSKTFFPQALSTGLHSRISKDPDNSLILNTAPQGRTSKRNAQQINYAEFENLNDDYDFEDVPTATGTTNAMVNNHIGSNTQKHLLKHARTTRYPEALDDDQNIEEVAKQTDLLIPIRLNLEYNNGNSKLVDSFMWNINDSLISPQDFATILCTDMELPAHLHQEITDSITKQIEEYNFVSSIQLPPNRDYHVIIDLSVNLNKQLYQDRFEWDLVQNDVSPEEFADIVVADLGLALEFKPTISHALYESTLRMKKEIMDGTYNHILHKYQQVSGLIFECGIRISTESSVHNGNDQWEPVVEILTPWEIEKREIERERNIRRLKRENMRREVDDHGTKRRAPYRRRLDDLAF
ncbi:Piso0_003430 [Millerozyma farinosa CBS 7064]|uniref:Piso0_003430 protein n=1 Tax=Pichia sorbitophila (strain ATCC MYA-4447 / BCRC 22081 / CBS 7064 / NBRC 10061 / NRRL Y-12695) TaxID=559304 RepID=G8YI30_PICSO|nr:Piso0_003430 [Millerozyma farinosa CBS 7064]CCE81082.1 Piso0_003430 [Millerozyma farinosa CBS 7064]